MYLDLSSVLAIILLIVIAVSIWFWNDSLRARERMTVTCSRICSDMHLQFLDETVSLARLRLTRTPIGSLAWRRTYIFEFSESGSDRWKGWALLTGRRVDSVQLDNPQGVTILGSTAPSHVDTIPCGQPRSDGEDHKHLH